MHKRNISIFLKELFRILQELEPPFQKENSKGS